MCRHSHPYINARTTLFIVNLIRFKSESQSCLRDGVENDLRTWVGDEIPRSRVDVSYLIFFVTMVSFALFKILCKKSAANTKNKK